MDSVNNIIEELRKDTSFMENITCWETISAGKGKFVPFPDSLDPALGKIISSRGISELYSHQAEAYGHVRKGKSILVVTPTASGKTLCYNLPVLQGLMEDREAKALYLFPTKALSQDQQSELNEILLGGDLPVKVSTYDGDTPSSVRAAARETGRIIISNPDMLHSGILPNHPKWIRFLSRIKYVVIDEIHIYRGVFGAHVINLLRRLNRILAFYGASPVFICCSATIGNPKEHAERILERDMVIIDGNGAPSGTKHVLLYNPPVVDAVQGIRRGVVLESRRLAVRFLKKGIKTIVFARSRVNTELIASYINHQLKNHFNENSRIRVESYRGGYLPNERREIEKGLRDGSIKGVVSTNALELGIDIGGLDVSILAGFPGSIASTWQQAGRAGRRNTVSLVIIVASSAPVDQYLVSHPEYLFGKSPESAYSDSDNIYVLSDHLKCALFELPFKRNEPFGTSAEELLSYLEETGVCRYTEGSYFWSDRSYPAEQVSLRSATSENVVIINTSRGNEVLGEMDRPSAKELLFKDAIYIHRGSQYTVELLDIENKKCLVKESDVNYYTDAIVKRDIKVLAKDRENRIEGINLLIGDILVRSQVAKFKKLRFHTHENIGSGDIFLPEEEMHTRALICLFTAGTVPGDLFNSYSTLLKEQIIASLGTLIRNVAPFFLLCDRSDLGIAERLKDPELDVPALFIYDSSPGGSGLSEGLEDTLSFVFRAALDIVRDCSCQRGCPSCVGPDDGKAGEENRREAVYKFLSEWLGEA